MKGESVRESGIADSGETLIASDIENHVLLRVDKTTAATSVIGPTTGILASLSYDATTGTVYGTDSGTGALYIVDATTGALTVVGYTGISLPHGSAIDRAGTLYVCGQFPELLYKVDKATAQSTAIGPLPQFISALDFDPTSGTLYGSVAGYGSGGALYTIDTRSGQSTLVAPTHRMTAIAFDATGQLYGADNGLFAGSPNPFLRLDKHDGSYIEIGSLGVRNVLAIQFLAPTCANPVSVDLTPQTLNLRSMGHWVTATLEPEPPTSPGDIDIASILLNGSVPVDVSAPTSIGDEDGDGRPDLTVKFDRAAVEMTLSEGEAVSVTIEGEIGNGCFEATDTIRVIRGHVTAPSAGSVLQGGSTAEVRWDTPAGVQVQSVAVLLSADEGMTWDLVAHELPNTGSYVWTVPSSGTGQATIAVVLVESADESGFYVAGVLGVSDGFVITTPLGVGEGPIELALQGSVPNPSRDLNVRFTLSNAPATLVVYDVSGREVSRRGVGSLGAGRHMVTLGTSRTLGPGIYLVHLIQGDRRLIARAVIVR